MFSEASSSSFSFWVNLFCSINVRRGTQGFILLWHALLCLQWFAITREHALLIVADHLYYNKFKWNCKVKLVPWNTCSLFTSVYRSIQRALALVLFYCRNDPWDSWDVYKHCVCQGHFLPQEESELKQNWIFISSQYQNCVCGIPIRFWWPSLQLSAAWSRESELLSRWTLYYNLSPCMASYFLPQQFSYSDNIRNWCFKTSVQPSQPTCCYVFTLYKYCAAVIYYGRIVLEKVIEDKVETFEYS